MFGGIQGVPGGESGGSGEVRSIFCPMGRRVLRLPGASPGESVKLRPKARVPEVSLQEARGLTGKAGRPRAEASASIIEHREDLLGLASVVQGFCRG